MIPTGWEKAFSRSQKRPYYYHAASGTSLWHLHEVEEFIKKNETAKPSGGADGPSRLDVGEVDCPPLKGSDSVKKEQSRDECRNLEGVGCSAGLKTSNGEDKNAEEKRVLALEMFEKRMRDVVDKFMDDSSINTIRLGPFSKDQRYILREIADDWELSSMSEFEEMTKNTYIHVFKAGFHPDELRAANKASQPDDVASATTTKKKTRKENDSEPGAQSLDLIKVGVIKRDRRTIEEIQRDNKKAKTESQSETSIDQK